MVRLPAPRQPRQPGLISSIETSVKSQQSTPTSQHWLSPEGGRGCGRRGRARRGGISTRPQAVVAERQMGAIGERDVAQALDAGPEKAGRLDAFGMIVIAERQMNLAVEPAQVRLVIGEGEVAEVVYDVAGPHHLVVAFDHDVVHLRDEGERAFRQLDDTGAAEVAVGREENADG
jgi:hypothetical protein